jgi:hypothetical protein
VEVSVNAHLKRPLKTTPGSQVLDTACVPLSTTRWLRHARRVHGMLRKSSHMYVTPIFQCQIIQIHTYHLRFIPEGIAEASEILLRDGHVLAKLVSYE